MIKKIYLLVFTVICAQYCNAQTDKEFWFAAPEVSADYVSPTMILDRPIILRITAYQSTSVVTISQPAAGGMPTQTITIAANTTQAVDLTNWIDDIECKPGDVIQNRGIKITGTNPISVYYEVNSFNGGLNPEFFVLKGGNATGTEFYISSQTLMTNSSNYSPLPYSSFNIVATEDNTHVTITPTNNIIGHTGGAPFTVTLNMGQTYAAIAVSEAASQHLQGSHVTADKPIAITLSDDLLTGVYGTCADVAGDQTVPVSTTGTEYIAVKGNLTAPYDKLYITATQGGTTVTQDGVLVTTLGAGQQVQLNINNASTYVQTSHPAYAYQLSGNVCEVGSAILPKINCTGSSTVSIARNTAEAFVLMLAVSNGGQSGFLLNGVSSPLLTAAQFSAVPGTGGQYYAAKVVLPLATYPLGSLVNVSNTVQVFQMGVLQGGVGTGTGYGFFSDFESVKAKATASNPNICIGDDLQLLANGVVSATYSWTGPNAFTSTSQNPLIHNATALNAGQYILNITVPGCGVYADTLVMPASPKPVVTISPTNSTLCSGNNVTLLAAGAATYSWAPSTGLNSTTTASVTATPPTTITYTVTGTNTAGCNDTAMATIIVIPTPVLSILPNTGTLCSGSSLMLTVTGATTYSWSPATGLSATTGASVMASPTNNTTYTVTGTNGGLCSATATKTITVVPIPAAPVVASPINYCRNAAASPLTATGNNLLWYTTLTGGTGTATAPTPSTATTGNATWYVSQTTNGCESGRTAITVNVSVTPPPVVTPSINICQYDTMPAIVATGSHILWYSASSGGIGSTATPVVNAAVPGSIIWYASQTVGGCESDRVPVSITVHAKPAPPQTARVTFCQNQLPIALIASGSSLLWYTTATGGIGSPTAPVITGNGARTQTWYVSQRINGCESDRAALPVTVSPEIYLLYALRDSAKCSQKGIVDITPYGGAAPYTIGISGAASQDKSGVTAMVTDSLVAGNYSIHVVNADGCTFDTSITMPGTKQMTLSLEEERPPSCYGGHDGSITVQGGGSDGPYKYTVGAPPISNATGVFTSMGAGSYIIKAQDGFGCGASIGAVLEQPEEITIGATVKPNYCHCNGGGDGSVIVVASGGIKPYRYLWSTGQNGPEAAGLSRGTYIVTVTDGHNCKDSMVNQVVDSANNLFIPTAFTPNGDGLNDVFRVHYIGNIYDISVSVYNRYGQRVYNSNEPSGAWNGSYKGIPQDMGTYFYNVEITCGTEKKGTVSYKGNVTLIR